MSSSALTTTTLSSSSSFASLSTPNLGTHFLIPSSSFSTSSAPTSNRTESARASLSSSETTTLLARRGSEIFVNKSAILSLISEKNTKNANNELTLLAGKISLLRPTELEEIRIPLEEFFKYFFSSPRRTDSQNFVNYVDWSRGRTIENSSNPVTPQPLQGRNSGISLNEVIGVNGIVAAPATPNSKAIHYEEATTTPGRDSATNTTEAQSLASDSSSSAQTSLSVTTTLNASASNLEIQNALTPDSSSSAQTSQTASAT